MTIKINGKETETQSADLGQLAEERSLPAQGTAMALSGKMVPRQDWMAMLVWMAISATERMSVKELMQPARVILGTLQAKVILYLPQEIMALVIILQAMAVAMLIWVIPEMLETRTAAIVVEAVQGGVQV